MLPCNKISLLFKNGLIASRRSLSTSLNNYNKVTVIGAAGSIGQPLSLLLAHSHLIKQLALYDIQNAHGISTDISHIDTACKIFGYDGQKNLANALAESDLVLIPAGVPRKPGMSRDDLFNTNADVIIDIITEVSKHCPKAFIAIITNPVNSLVPLAAEVLKKTGVYNKSKLCGITTLDIVRANKFLSELKELDVSKVSVPVVGGHAGKTIIPLLSQATPKANFLPGELEELTVNIQEAGTKVVEAKAGKGSASLSMAYAAARFSFSVLEAKQGREGVVECAYVESQLCDGLSFFASPQLLGRTGIEKDLGLGKISDYEHSQILAIKKELADQIKKGIEYPGLAKVVKK